MRGWHQARTMNLEENGARFRGKTLLQSSNDDEKHHQITEILRDNEKRRGWVNNENDLKSILERHLTDGTHSYVTLEKN